MTASVKLLEEIHRLFAEQLKTEILEYQNQEIFTPIPAADKAVYAKFLKDNNVLCVPASAEDLAELRDKLQGKGREQTIAKLKAEISGDLDGFSLN